MVYIDTFHRKFDSLANQLLVLTTVVVVVVVVIVVW